MVGPNSLFVWPDLSCLISVSNTNKRRGGGGGYEGMLEVGSYEGMLEGGVRGCWRGG